MKNQNCITHPQLETKSVIALRVDLQNSIFYDCFGNTIGWFNEHNNEIKWLTNKRDEFEEILTSDFRFGSSPFQIEFVKNITWGVKSTFIYPKQIIEDDPDPDGGLSVAHAR